MLACQNGNIPALGVWRWKLHEFGIEPAVELLRSSGLQASSLSSTGGFTGSDGYTYRDSIEEGRQAVEEAVAIGAQCLVAVSGARARHTRNHARRMVVEALRALGDMAAERGLSIAIQPLRNPDGMKSTFLNTLDATLDVVHRVDRNNVGLVFDTFQLAEEVELDSRLREIAPYVKLAMLCDRMPTPEGPVRCLPGQGRLPLTEWIERLDEAGFRGTYEMHVPTSEVWEQPAEDLVRTCAASLRRLILDRADVA